MKRILYLSNIEVPYRVRLFNELAKHCELTVLYERRRSSNRDKAWAGSEQRRYSVKYLKGINIHGEKSFSLGIFKHIFAGYDMVIVGCFNSPVQMMAIAAMRLFRIPYILNVDGEIFIAEKNFKNSVKRFFLKGAKKYLAAGEKSAASLKPVSGGKEVIPYYFSSLNRQELAENAKSAKPRGNNVLVVGQYFDYKGMDIALKAARMDSSINYTFVGMGSRTGLFQNEQNTPPAGNVKVIPFLQKEELAELYKTCGLLVLPSRRECWGLVINEAASYGTPIVSTAGSGAAVEFLGDHYPHYLAAPGDAEDLLTKIRAALASGDKAEYSKFLISKSAGYSIENCTLAHLRACDIDIDIKE